MKKFNFAGRFKWMALTSVAVICMLFTPMGKCVNADIVTGSQTMFLPPNTVSLDLSINDATDQVDIIAQGRTDGWFGIGFGNTVMNGTYAIIYEFGGGVTERKLGNHNPGSVLASTVSLVSDTSSGGVRTVHLQRTLDVGNSDYFTFTATPGNIDLISATRTGNFGFHGSSFTISNIQLSQIPEPTSGVIIGLVFASGALLRRRV